jgi:hypothetical protein
MRATCRGLFRKHIADDVMMAVNRQIAVHFLMRSWNR